MRRGGRGLQINGGSNVVGARDVEKYWERKSARISKIIRTTVTAPFWVLATNNVGWAAAEAAEAEAAVCVYGRYNRIWTPDAISEETTR
jgi:hypothetical protein